MQLQDDRVLPGRRPLGTTYAAEEGNVPDEIQALTQRCLKGDQGAMMQLVERFRDQVYGLCYRMLGQREDAEDVTQEAFLRALRNLASWDPSRAFKPWLMTIAGNRCRTLLSRRARRPTATILPDAVADPRAEQADGDALTEEVRLGLADLRPEYRQAFLLFHEQELGYSEIAEALGVPLGTVKTWVHRARKQLIERLRQREVIEPARSESA